MERRWTPLGGPSSLKTAPDCSTSAARPSCLRRGGSCGSGVAVLGSSSVTHAGQGSQEGNVNLCLNGVSTIARASLPRQAAEMWSRSCHGCCGTRAPPSSSPEALERGVTEERDRPDSAVSLEKPEAGQETCALCKID